MRQLDHLDNLEQCQNEWRLKTKNCHSEAISRDPQRLNSPHSLRAYATCGIVPPTALGAPTLRQQLEEGVDGASCVDRSDPTGITTQDALNACNEAGFPTGSTQQKMRVNENFMHHVDNRKDVLLRAEIRRQLIAEEVFERRRRAHVEGNSVLSSFRCELSSPDSAEHGVFPVSSPTNKNTVAAERWAAHPRSDTAMTSIQQQRPEAKEPARRLLERGVLGGSSADTVPDGTVVQGAPVETVAEDDHPSKRAMTNTAADTAVKAREAPLHEDDAPPAPPISPREQGEVFYYYCANATVAGRILECREQSLS
ncbi:putative dynein heavy chain [Trypanosoma rangeli]|uniref:Putative dynein heavy chain n=1 Tax=Trypanosoma rangeli TaxID=5698 RepID=A0A422NS29_TRYRA|nr:putative dynein heavy chain [Trypanosoma rangeli]RNF08256.1 putative dynein heavy chain [Trypanosoma rangeli]|eukprot:RNF08256.1 putative dynein heavy chain [Trypanosoma rangeli]